MTLSFDELYFRNIFEKQQKTFSLFTQPLFHTREVERIFKICANPRLRLAYLSWILPRAWQMQSVFIHNVIYRYLTEFTIHDILWCLLQLLGAVWRAGGWCPVVKLLLESCFRRWFQSRLCNMYDDDWRCHLRHPHLVHRSCFARWVVFSNYMYWLS